DVEHKILGHCARPLGYGVVAVITATWASETPVAVILALPSLQNWFGEVMLMTTPPTVLVPITPVSGAVGCHQPAGTRAFCANAVTVPNEPPAISNWALSASHCDSRNLMVCCWVSMTSRKFPGQSVLGVGVG